jgi:Domain of unknown function (DUF4382)
MLKNRTASLLSSALLALALVACGGGEQKVTLKLTDAPGEGVEKAVVTISRITLKGHADANDDDSDGLRGKDGESKGEIVLLDEPVTTDLLTLANDAVDLVKDARVPTGTYKELRFVITGAYLQVNEGGVSRIYASSRDYAGLPAGAQVDGSLQMPSLASSGLKVKFANDADVSITSEGDQQVILVDFDVAQSFGHAAASEKWVMHPVVKGADLAFSGNVKVTLTPASGVDAPAADALVAVLVNADGSRESLGFSVGADGVYSADFKYLLPGSYSVGVELAQAAAQAGASFGTDPDHAVSTTVGSGAQSDVAFRLTSFSAAAQ